jgi:hypothetical protein
MTRLDAALRAGKAAAGVIHSLSLHARLAPVNKLVAHDIMRFCKFDETKFARDIA